MPYNTQTPFGSIDSINSTSNSESTDTVIDIDDSTLNLYTPDLSFVGSYNTLYSQSEQNSIISTTETHTETQSTLDTYCSQDRLFSEYNNLLCKYNSCLVNCDRHDAQISTLTDVIAVMFASFVFYLLVCYVTTLVE